MCLIPLDSAVLHNSSPKMSCMKSNNHAFAVIYMRLVMSFNSILLQMGSYFTLLMFVCDFTSRFELVCPLVFILETHAKDIRNLVTVSLI